MNNRKNRPSTRLWNASYRLLFLVWLNLTLREVSAQALDQPGVLLYDTHGAEDESQWTRIIGSPEVSKPENIILQNGLIRITYPARKADPKSGFSPLSERASHVLHLKEAGNYKTVQDEEFGDWTYVGGAFNDGPAKVEIVQNSPDSCTVRYCFPDHTMSAADSERPGALAPVQKTITLRKEEFGYTARVAVKGEFRGEREVGFGGTRTHLFNYSFFGGQLWTLGKNRIDGCCDYIFPKADLQVGGDSWAVGFAPESSYYRIVCLPPSGPSATAALRFSQFHSSSPEKPNTAGSIIHHTMRPLPEYEAYLAAVPYDSSFASVVRAEADSLVIRVPVEGLYAIYSQKVEAGKEQQGRYYPALPCLHLRSGENRIPNGAQSLEFPLVVPISNGKDFPVDISETYKKTFVPSPLLNSGG